MFVETIPTEKFNYVLETLIERGWEILYVYGGFDAWIDYGEVHLKQNGILVKFVWDNWTEGEIKADIEIEEIRALL
ncbi:hypothetical protein EON83_08100 [bacterium]|nr:MAG: hypothetical protein EON83_08100 [bacterium]